VIEEIHPIKCTSFLPLSLGFENAKTALALVGIVSKRRLRTIDDQVNRPNGRVTILSTARNMQLLCSGVSRR